VARDWRDERIEVLEKIVAEQRAMIEKLLKRVDELERKLSESSNNSNKPPSSDTPEQRQDRPKQESSGRKRGGQPGHKPHKRTFLEPTRVEECWPEECAECGDRLQHIDTRDVYRHQVIELPEIAPLVYEYRCHAVECETCGSTNRAALPFGVPTSMVGPRLQALIGLLTGSCKMSRRDAVMLLRDVLGIPISLGALSEAEERVSDAIAPAVDEAIAHVRKQTVKHTDATGWLRAGRPRTLITIATTLLSVYFIVANGTTSTWQRILGSVHGLLVSDRATSLGFWAMDRRQICWAHLLRKFISFSERNDAGARIGIDLVAWTRVLFSNFHRVRDGTMSLAAFGRKTEHIRKEIERLVRRGAALKLRGLSGSCADILAHQQALWTFVERADVEPTNNLAERDLRPFVLWRKRCFGSQSDRGERYAERIMTVVQSLRKQGRHVFAFLCEACANNLVSRRPPTIIPSTR
jgi:transposase